MATVGELRALAGRDLSTLQCRSPSPELAYVTEQELARWAPEELLRTAAQLKRKDREFAVVWRRLCSEQQQPVAPKRLRRS